MFLPKKISQKLSCLEHLYNTSPEELEDHEVKNYKTIMKETRESIKAFLECRYSGSIAPELEKLEKKLKEIS